MEDNPAVNLNQENLGTSIIAAKYQGGVVLGADSRTTTGNYVSNRISNKLTAVTDKIFCCRSGSAADTQVISEYVRYYLDMHISELGEPPTVKTAASLFQQLCYYNKNFISAGIICAGWDLYEGPSVYSIPIGGALVNLPFTIGGSGSMYIYGFCDANWKDNMTKEEAEKFVVEALTLAMSRDGSSGGVIRLVHINQDGSQFKLIAGEANMPKFYEA